MIQQHNIRRLGVISKVRWTHLRHRVARSAQQLSDRWVPPGAVDHPGRQNIHQAARPPLKLLHGSTATVEPELSGINQRTTTPPKSPQVCAPACIASAIDGRGAISSAPAGSPHWQGTSRAYDWPADIDTRGGSDSETCGWLNAWFARARKHRARIHPPHTPPPAMLPRSDFELAVRSRRRMPCAAPPPHPFPAAPARLLHRWRWKGGGDPNGGGIARHRLLPQTPHPAPRIHSPRDYTLQFYTLP